MATLATTVPEDPTKSPVKKLKVKSPETDANRRERYEQKRVSVAVVLEYGITILANSREIFNVRFLFAIDFSKSSQRVGAWFVVRLRKEVGFVGAEPGRVPNMDKHTIWISGLSPTRTPC